MAFRKFFKESENRMVLVENNGGSPSYPSPRRKKYNSGNVPVLFSTEVIKLNSRGIPQSRIFIVNQICFLILTPKKNKCKRKVLLTSISGISTSPHWDNIICFHIENQPDLLLVAPDKGEIVNVFQKLSENNIHIRHNSSDSFFFKPKVGLNHQISFHCPDGRERNHARIFVDWKDENGSSIENSIDTQTPPDTPVEGPNVQPKEEEMIVESEIETPTQSQSQGNLSRSSEDLVEFCDSDDYDSEDDIQKKKIKLRESTLLSKMMNVIPMTDKKSKDAPLSRLNMESENYVFYNWVMDEETNSSEFRVKAWQLQGQREYMEDVILIDYCLNLQTSTSTSDLDMSRSSSSTLKKNQRSSTGLRNTNKYLGHLLLGMFDGHGGRACAEWLGNNIKEIIENSWVKVNGNMKKCLELAFQKANKKILKDKTISDAGSTAIISIIKDGKIYIASAGDTRALICKSEGHERLTIDHRVSNPGERKRIIDMGGVIRDNRLVVGNGDINLARSLGDRRFQPFVISDPDYLEYTIKDEDEYLVIATDGVWDSMDEKTVRGFVKNKQDPKKICSVACAFGSKDNLSVILVCLKNPL